MMRDIVCFSLLKTQSDLTSQKKARTIEYS